MATQSGFLRGTAPSGENLGPLAIYETDANGAPVTEGETFRRLLKFEPLAGTELRAIETTTDRYHGMAVDGADPAATVWDVVRFYKTSGEIVRVRFLSDVSWNAASTGTGW